MEEHQAELAESPQTLERAQRPANAAEGLRKHCRHPFTHLVFHLTLLAIAPVLKDVSLYLSINFCCLARGAWRRRRPFYDRRGALPV